MAHIIVSGASSVVGDYLLPGLALGGHRVTALSRRPPIWSEAGRQLGFKPRGLAPEFWA